MNLDEHDQQSLALWAADCAEHVLPLFEQQHPQDTRPRAAIAAARAWARGEIKCGAAREAAFAAHAAARDTSHGAARAAARSAGHAAASAHMARHAAPAADYAIKAAMAADRRAADAEHHWQQQCLRRYSAS